MRIQSLANYLHLGYCSFDARLEGGGSMAGDIHGYYALLGLDPKCSQAQIREAFRARAKQVHPDVNKSASAEEAFKRLNAAYTVLSDPVRRAAYDQASYRPEAEARTQQKLEPLRCSKCDRVTAQPRFLVFWSCESFVIAAQRRPRQGLYCAECARSEGTRASVRSTLLGWWSIPGVVHTPITIFGNAMGGTRDRKSEKELLFYNAVAFAQDGQETIAYSLAREVAETAVDQSLVGRARSLMDVLKQHGIPPETPRLADPWRFRFGTLILHTLIAVLMPVIAFRLMVACIVMSPQRPVVPDHEAEQAAAPLPPCAKTLASGDILSGKVRRIRHGHSLTIENGMSSPAIVNVLNAETGALQFAFFVDKGGTGKVTGLRDGTYRIEYAMGDFVAADCQSFNSISSASRFPADETLTTKREGYDVITSRLSYTLYSVPDGTVHPETIDPALFRSHQTSPLDGAAAQSPASPDGT